MSDEDASSVGISYREFINTDPPLLAEIWRRNEHFRGIVDHITPQTIEDSILSRPWFNRRALIVALKDEQPIGFVLSGFAANETRCDWNPQEGVVSLLRVVPCAEADTVADELMNRAIEFLRASGARRITSGGRFPFAPFLQGLYGGSRVPGVLDADSVMLTAFERAGFERVDTVLIFHRKLSGFRVPVDRLVAQHRRQYEIAANTDPPFADWWEACTLGKATRTRFEVLARSSGC